MKHVFKTMICKAEASDDGTITAVASTPDPDRMDDVVAPSWKLDDFRRSPVIMHAHDYEGPVVGKAVEIDLVGDTLMMRVKFDEHESNPLGQRLANQYREGFMSAFSVGFAPGKVTPRSQLPKDHPAYSEKSAGSYMTENSLLEVSAVAIPANPQALAVRAKRWGLEPEAVKMPLPPASMAPKAKHIINVEETEDTYTITYAKAEHDMAPEEPEAEGYGGYGDDDEDDDRKLRSVVRDELLSLFADSTDEQVQDGLDVFLNDSTPAPASDDFGALFTQGE
jgi:hypothetical protein|tara:strand:- start:1407 stop:2246 length:840 start_codon:yes stop_codon:yes gene_type:complete